MDVIWQQAVTEKGDFLEFSVMNQLLEMMVSVPIVFEKFLAIVAGANHMIQSLNSFDPGSRTSATAVDVSEKATWSPT